jgi:hypothetical protein
MATKQTLQSQPTPPPEPEPLYRLHRIFAALTELLLKEKVLKLPDYVNSEREPTGNQKTSDETSEVG